MADIALSAGDADLQQIDNLCDELSVRAETVRDEQALLGRLVDRTARTRPYMARQYEAMLHQVRERYRRLHELILRFCR